MASKMGKAGLHLLNLLRFGEMDDSVEDSHHFLHNIMDGLANCGQCDGKGVCHDPVVSLTGSPVIVVTTTSISWLHP